MYCTTRRDEFRLFEFVHQSKGVHMDYVIPAEVVADALNAAVKKANLPIRDLLIRGALSGAFLGYATSLVFVALSQGMPGIFGAIIFPVGFVMLVLLGFEL